MTRRVAVFAVVGLLWNSAASALEIDPNVAPEVNIGGRAVVSVDQVHAKPPSAGGHAHEHGSETTLNTADSSLLFGFSKYLFDDQSYAFAVVGLKTVESGSELDRDLYAHQMFAGVGGRRFEVIAGRTNLPNSLVSFPTARDDDALDFTVVGNALIDAHAEEYQLFGEQIRARGWLDPFWSVTIAGTARAATENASVATDSMNGQFVAVAYDVPKPVHVGRGVRYAGLALDRQELNDLGGGTGKNVRAVLAGAVITLNDDPQAEWSLDVQYIDVAGLRGVDLSEGFGRARASSRTIAAAVRYGHRPSLQTKWQAALMLAAKDYTDVSASRSTMIAPTVSWWIGSGVELLGQLQHIRNEDALAAALDVATDHRMMVGISFAFDYTINESVGSRGGILATEHGMGTLGPVLGGH